MHTTSALYKRLLRDEHHRKEFKAHIAGMDYLQDQLIDLETHGGVFDQPDIGNCVSRQIDLTLRAPGSIPKGAKIQVFARLTLGQEVSEWIPKGVFYFANRKTDKRIGRMEVHGYDAMRRTGETWLTPAYDRRNWPMPPMEAARDIAARIGVELDPRTVLDSAFPVPYPVDENGDLAMDDILSGLAVSNAGNWIITDEGKLLLLRLGDIPPETFYLVDEFGDAITFGGVRILVG